MKYLKLILIRNTLQFKNNKLQRQMLYIYKVICKYKQNLR